MAAITLPMPPPRPNINTRKMVYNQLQPLQSLQNQEKTCIPHEEYPECTRCRHPTACTQERVGRKLSVREEYDEILIQLVGTFNESRRIDQSTLKASSLSSMALFSLTSTVGDRSFNSASPFLGYFKTIQSFQPINLQHTQ